MNIRIYGTGCAKCTQLTENAKAAAAQLGVDAQVEKVTDIMEITRAGVLSTPAIAVDGRVRASGKALTVDQIKALLKT